MAEGGTGNTTGNGGRGDLASALALNSGQQQDRRRTSDDNSRLSDESIGGADESRPSVLTPGAATQSYTSGQEETVEGPIAGGGLLQTSGMELERMRQQEQQMQRTQAQFVGQPGAAQAGNLEARPTRGPAGAAGQGAQPAEEEEEEEPSEEELAQELEAQQQQSFRQQVQSRAQDQLKKQAQQQLEKQAEKLAKQAVNQGSRFALEGAEVASSEALIPLLILFVQMNIQLVMKYIFRPLIAGASEDVDNALRGTPFFDQSLAEDVAIVAIDGLMCCSAPCTNPACMPFTFLIIVIVILAKLIGVGGK